MKAIVTGGAGFIGHHLVRRLIERGDRVVVIDNFTGGRFPERIVEGATYVECDIGAPQNAHDLARYFYGADFVFHLAALPRVQYSIEHPIETEQVNVWGTVAVLEAARLTEGCKVIFASSSSVYGEPTELPVSERVALNPMSPYASQKADSEWFCRMYAEGNRLSTVSLRLFNVYGPGADPEGAYALVVAKFIAQRERGEPMTITGDGAQTRDFTHVRDVVRAMILAAERSADDGEAINIGGGRQVSVNEIAALIGGPTVHVEARVEPHDTLADITLAKKLLGWEPQISFEEGVAELKALHGLS